MYYSTRAKKLPVFLTVEEQKRLLMQPNLRYPTGERNYLLMKVMLAIGLRLNEALSLRWKDVDLLSGQVMVRFGKGSKDRALWFSEDLIELLRHWKKRQIKRVGSCELVFTTLHGTKLFQAYAREMVYRYRRKAGIEKHISPHTLRHSFATDLYRKTHNIRLVQKALGHANIQSTTIYTHLVDEDLEKALKNLR